MLWNFSFLFTKRLLNINIFIIIIIIKVIKSYIWTHTWKLERIFRFVRATLTCGETKSEIVFYVLLLFINTNCKLNQQATNVSTFKAPPEKKFPWRISLSSRFIFYKEWTTDRRTTDRPAMEWKKTLIFLSVWKFCWLVVRSFFFFAKDHLLQLTSL